MFSDDPEQDLELVSFIHDQIIEASGGAQGFHDEKLIRSALARPLHSAFGEDIYRDTLDRASALLDSIATITAFVMGTNEPQWQWQRTIFTATISLSPIPMKSMKLLCWRL